MKVFVTGATGWVGSATVRELIANGHQVVGLARNEERAATLADTGAEILVGTLNDNDTLLKGVNEAEAVIHTAFIHNFNDFGTSVQTESRVIALLGQALAGSNRPFIVTAGTAGLAPGRVLTEDIAPGQYGPIGPRSSEVDGLSYASQGVKAMSMRLPPTVHGDGDHGFVARLVEIAREKGVSAYPGDGSNRWAAGHRFDAARLYRLALEKGTAGTSYHAVGDEGVSSRDIAEVIGRHLNLPVVSVPVEKAGEHFGWLGAFFQLDLPASSALTQEWLGWKPQEVGLIEDLEQGHYFKGH